MLINNKTIKIFMKKVQVYIGDIYGRYTSKTIRYNEYKQFF